MLADRRLFLVIRWLQLTTVTVKATIHLTLIQPEGETKKGSDHQRKHFLLFNDRAARGQQQAWNSRPAWATEKSLSVCLSVSPSIHSPWYTTFSQVVSPPDLTALNSLEQAS